MKREKRRAGGARNRRHDARSRVDDARNMRRRRDAGVKSGQPAHTDQAKRGSAGVKCTGAGAGDVRAKRTGKRVNVEVTCARDYALKRKLPANKKKHYHRKMMAFFNDYRTTVSYEDY